MSLINQPMILHGNDTSIYLPSNDIIPDHAADLNDTIIDIYTLDNDPVDHTLIPGTNRVFSFAQAGRNSAETSDPSSTGDLALTISAYSPSWSGFPTDIIALGFQGITLDSICHISISADVSVSHAELTIEGYVGSGMPSTDDTRWRTLLNKIEVEESASFDIESPLFCDYHSDDKLYLKIRNRSMINQWDVSSMFMTITGLSITTKTRHTNQNFQVF